MNRASERARLSVTYDAARALPVAFGHGAERRVEAGRVVGARTEVAQQQVATVATLAAVVLVTAAADLLLQDVVARLWELLAQLKHNNSSRHTVNTCDVIILFTYV